MKKNILITFNNTHSVMHFEKKINDNNKYDIKMILMPTPRSLSFSCGLCIKLQEVELNDILDIVAKENLQYKDLFEITQNGYNLI